MRKIFLFGRFVRICFIISFAFIVYATFDMCLQNRFDIKYILLTLLVILFVVFGLIWLYSLGLSINCKEDRLILALGLTKVNQYERVLSNVESIDIEKKINLGFDFVIKYKDGYIERIKYKFYRISILEEGQFKRLKKQIKKLSERM